MSTLYKRKLNKISKKLDSISSKGKDNILEYYKYINELVDKGDYAVLEEVINLYYKIDISKYATIQDFRDLVWNEICLQTNLPILVRISKLYKSKNLYQLSNYIYKEKNYEKNVSGGVVALGQINENERFTNDVDFLIKNKMYARLIGERIPFLEVIDINGVSTIIEDYDFNLNPEQNQFIQYQMAVDILLN